MTTPDTDDGNWSQRHGAAVREAAPQVPELASDELDVLWRQIQAQSALRTPRRSRLRSVVAGTVVVGVVGVSGVAAADVMGAFTGRGPSDAEDARLGGPGERLDPSAPDFASAVDQVTADIDFPSEETRESAVSWQAQDLSGTASEPTYVSTGAVRLWTAGNALCAWSNAWAEALHDDNAAAADKAATVILEAHRWTAITDTDPVMSGESEFSWLPTLEEAVRDQDLAAARRSLTGHGACMPGLAPELGLGKRW